MKLTTVRITNYRSAEDAGKFDVEPGVTCLVGKNESGKTAVLQALYHLNPAERSASFDEVVDYPARRTRERKRLPQNATIPVVRAGFHLEDEDVALVEEHLGEGALSSRDIEVSRGYRSAGRNWSIDWDEPRILGYLRGQLDLNAAATATVDTATTVEELLDALRKLEEPPANATELIRRITQWGETTFGCIATILGKRLPRFVYFDDYDYMPGKVSIPDLIHRRDQDNLTRGETALLSFLGMAGASPEDFHQTDQHERLIRELENAGATISDEVFEYWSQNKELAVELRTLQPEAGATGRLSQGPVLQVRVHNQRHRASVPFDERSRGFVWFFSFMAYFTELETATEQDLVLLLDEPGLTLHGRAQGDLLRLIGERLAPVHQVIYTTHSPFMVAADHLHGVRTVIDHEHAGTKVSAEIFQADKDTAFPLLTAMGIELTQTLFVGEHTLLLEGPSDLIYLDVLSNVLEERGRTGLDQRWVKTPIGGAGKLSTFVTLLGANDLHVAVVIDSSTREVGAIKRLRDNDQLSGNGLVRIGEFTSAENADIEDLFDRRFYIELVNLAYADELTTPLTTDDLNPDDPLVVRQVETYFRSHGISGGRFNHYKPAASLLRHHAKLARKISAATLTSAERLFERLNGLLPS